MAQLKPSLRLHPSALEDARRGPPVVGASRAWPAHPLPLLAVIGASLTCDRHNMATIT